MKKITTIGVGEDVKFKLEQERKGEKWDQFLLRLLNRAVQYDREKPAFDMQLRVLHEDKRHFEDLKKDLKQQFEDAKNQRELRLESELAKVKKENDHLVELLRLRSGDET